MQLPTEPKNKYIYENRYLSAKIIDRYRFLNFRKLKSDILVTTLCTVYK